MSRRVAAVSLILVLALLGGIAFAAPSDPYFSQQYALSKIRAEQAWGSSVGDGITIAIVDSGIDGQHIEFNVSGKLVGGIDLVDGGYPDDETASPEQCAEPGDPAPPPGNPGHGTHVSGIAAAVTNNGIGIAGTAPGARLMPVRVLNECGEGNSETVRQGIEWAVDHGARVINLSLGPNVVIFRATGTGIEEGIEYASSKGAVVVIAAGNEFLFPSGYGNLDALVVQSTNQNDQKAGSSNLAADAKWPIAAPGESILSTLPGNKLGTLSGTSMATPHVSGAAAILLCLGLNKEQTMKRLVDTADNIGALNAKRLNMERAVQGQGNCIAPASGGGGTGGGSTGGSGNSGGGSKPGGSRTSTPGQQSPASGETQPGPSETSPGSGGGSTSTVASGEGPNDPGESKTNANAIGAAVLLATGGIFYLVQKARRSYRHLG